MNFIFLTSAFRVHLTPFLHSLLPTENEMGRDQWIRLLFAIGELCLVLIYEGNQKSTSRLSDSFCNEILLIASVYSIQHLTKAQDVHTWIFMHEHKEPEEFS